MSTREKFRQFRGTSARSIRDLTEWTNQLKTDADTATQDIPPEANIEAIDNKLVHMWEAKESLRRRWKVQKHNRSLRKRIASLNREIEAYAQQLRRMKWEDKFNDMDRQIGAAKTWNILRNMLDPENTKLAHRHSINRLIHTFQGTEQDLLQELRNKYFPQTPLINHPDYRGQPNESLDRDIEEAQVRAVLLTLNTKSAPGPDGITNKMLRNLDDKSIAHLTEFFNEHWKSGTVPEQWKSAKIILIPKPGKRLFLEHLRPI